MYDALATGIQDAFRPSVQSAQWSHQVQLEDWSGKRMQRMNSALDLVRTAYN